MAALGFTWFTGTWVVVLVDWVVSASVVTLTQLGVGVFLIGNAVDIPDIGEWDS